MKHGNVLIIFNTAELKIFTGSYKGRKNFHAGHVSSFGILNDLLCRDLPIKKFYKKFTPYILAIQEITNVYVLLEMPELWNKIGIEATRDSKKKNLSSMW